MGCAPAYLALAVEADGDAGAADGLDPELSRELIVETAAGTAELLRRRIPPTSAAPSPRPVAAPRPPQGTRPPRRAGAFVAAVDGSSRRMRE